MNNEIKEILDNLIRYKNEGNQMKWSPEDILTIEDVWLLLDYITNLEQYYNDNVNKYEELLVKYSTLNSWYNSSKSRIDEAIKLLKQAGSYDEETKTFCDDVWKELPKLLNILTGDE